MIDNKNGTPEKKFAYGNVFTAEERKALADFFMNFFRSLKVLLDSATMSEGLIIEFCVFAYQSLLNNDLKIGGPMGRLLIRGIHARMQMEDEQDILAQEVLPVSGNEGAAAYIERYREAKRCFPQDIRAAVAALRLSEYLEKGEELRPLDFEEDGAAVCLDYMERLAAVYDYCRQVARDPHVRNDETVMGAAADLEGEYRGMLISKEIIRKKKETVIEEDIRLMLAQATGQSGEA